MQHEEKEALMATGRIDQVVFKLGSHAIHRASNPILGTVHEYTTGGDLSTICATARGIPQVLSVWRDQLGNCWMYIGWSCSDKLRLDRLANSPVTSITAAAPIVDVRGPHLVRIRASPRSTSKAVSASGEGAQTVSWYLAHICRVNVHILSDIQFILATLDLTTWPQIKPSTVKEAFAINWADTTDLSDSVRDYLVQAILTPRTLRVDVLLRMKDMLTLKTIASSKFDFCPANAVMRNRQVFILWCGHPDLQKSLRIFVGSSFWLESSMCHVAEIPICNRRACILVQETEVITNERTALDMVMRHFNTMASTLKDTWLYATVPKMVKNLFRPDGRLKASTVDGVLLPALRTVIAISQSTLVSHDYVQQVVPTPEATTWVIHCRQSQRRNMPGGVERQLWSILNNPPYGFVGVNDRVVMITEYCSSSAHPLRDRTAYQRILDVVLTYEKVVILSASPHRLSRRAEEFATILENLQTHGATWLYQSDRDENDDSSTLDDDSISTQHEGSAVWRTVQPQGLTNLKQRLVVSRQFALQGGFYARARLMLSRALLPEAAPAISALRNVITLACARHKIHFVMLVVRVSPDPKREESEIITSLGRQRDMLERIVPPKIPHRLVRLRLISAFSADAAREVGRELQKDKRRTLVFTVGMDRGIRGDRAYWELFKALGNNMAMSLIWDPFTDIKTSTALRLSASYASHKFVQEWEDVSQSSQRVRPSAGAFPRLQPIIWCGGGLAPLRPPDQAHLDRHMTNAGGFCTSSQAWQPPYYKAELPTQLAVAVQQYAEVEEIFKIFIMKATSLASENVDIIWVDGRGSFSCHCDYSNHDIDCCCSCYDCREAESCACVPGACACPPLCNCRCSYCHENADTLSECEECGGIMKRGSCRRCDDTSRRDDKYNQHCVAIGCTESGRKAYGAFCSMACVRATVPLSQIPVCSEVGCRLLAPTGWWGGRLCKLHFQEGRTARKQESDARKRREREEERIRQGKKQRLPNVACPYCTQMFTRPDNMRTHAWKQHQMTLPAGGYPAPLPPLLLRPSTPVCPYCPATFTGITDMTTHAQTYHGVSLPPEGYPAPIKPANFQPLSSNDAILSISTDEPDGHNDDIDVE